MNHPIVYEPLHPSNRSTNSVVNNGNGGGMAPLSGMPAGGTGFTSCPPDTSTSSLQQHNNNNNNNNVMNGNFSGNTVTQLPSYSCHVYGQPTMPNIPPRAVLDLNACGGGVGGGVGGGGSSGGGCGPNDMHPQFGADGRRGQYHHEPYPYESFNVGPCTCPLLVGTHAGGYGGPSIGPLPDLTLHGDTMNPDIVSHEAMDYESAPQYDQRQELVQQQQQLQQQQQRELRPNMNVPVRQKRNAGADWEQSGQSQPKRRM